MTSSKKHLCQVQRSHRKHGTITFKAATHHHVTNIVLFDSFDKTMIINFIINILYFNVSCNDGSCFPQPTTL